MAERFEFTLGSIEASIVGQALDVDVRQFPLRIRNSTVDPVRFVKLAKQVYRDLEDRRLSVSGELNRAVRTAFELFGGHRVSVAITGIDGRGDDIAVLTLTDGAQALGITQPPGEDELQFSLFSDDELVEVLTGVLPAVPAAPGGTLTVRRRADQPQSAMAARRLAEAEHDEDETDAFGNIQLRGVVRPGRSSRRERPAAADDDTMLAEILAGPRQGGGYLTANGHGRHDERRSAQPVTWLDTEQGRYLVHTDDEGGTVTARYAPAGRAQVTAAIQELISSVY
ncbi:ESX secretion-associated protein EspG [Amycolatopsis nigrescens]|uniref:ESX secretion-associated protein EspG n=1 Tax=Amycolatopsis nigrescens TaxID=381445 RepID=UPI000361DC4C|nr:ESX secretion-associated protein EspG [Amycolatopsis nigrescens]